jgi:hypothetical protein
MVEEREVAQKKRTEKEESKQASTPVESDVETPRSEGGDFEKPKK